ncbi:phage antirepressor N-terminal domain-containing protein [Xenorhabdus siamensis]|uniref:phage antirepressor N-terminal domain-containing protein n=1 Tax=Xenorhabdus siamensis TaxID=3136254 RepID=UPI0030F3CB43
MAIITIKEPSKTINISFYGSDLYVVNYNNEPYVPMKPIVEGMGLDWTGQLNKLRQRFSKGIEEITIPTLGGPQKMLCLQLRKLAGWLLTIYPNKVKPEIKDKVIRYQDECDDVLYEYWTKGEIKAKRKTVYEHLDLSIEVDNINAACRNMDRLIDVWSRLNPHLSVLSPDIAYAFNGAIGNVEGPLFSLKMAIERKSKILLNQHLVTDGQFR